MEEKKKINVFTYLLSPDARFNIVIPLILYYIAFALWGAGSAIFAIAIYLGVLQFFRKSESSFSIIVLILVSGLTHYLYLEGYTIAGIDNEGVFLSISSALSLALVFGIYSLLGRPVIQTFAEKAMPNIKNLPAYGSKKYIQVWHEVSLAWIIVYFVKACVVYALFRYSSISMSAVILIAEWPLVILMIFFSVRWPKYRWSK